ncbi:MAG: M81 family metallopeptidase [Planctomycetales bacterium]
MGLRIAVAEIGQETNSFSPLPTTIRDFEAYGLYFGQEILERMQNAGPLGGLFQVAAERGETVTWFPLVRAWAGAGGTITTDAFDFLRDRLIAGLRESLPADALFLALHGAAASEVDDDVEGRLLEEVRQVVGSRLPVIFSLDHHANITQRMVSHATVLIGHETQPHDPLATGRKTARILFDLLEGKVRPTVAWRKIPMITPQDQFLTSQGPMREWFDQAREMERRPGVIDVSPYPMQPWLDAREGGWAVVVHTDGNQELAETLADESAAKAWSLRADFWKSGRTPVAAAVRQAGTAQSGLTILSDTGDSVYGGAPGDSTCILQELLAQPPSGLALVPIVDVQAVEAGFAAGVGASITLSLGGAVDRIFTRPMEVTGRVAAISQGVTLELEERGACDVGRTLLLEAGQLRIVVLDQRSFAINHPILYTHLGLDISEARIVVLKTASNFQFFRHWRPTLIRIDSPGTTQSDLTAFEWRHLPRPIYPL